MDLVVERSGGPGRPFLWAHGLTSSTAAERAAGTFQWEGLDVVRYDARGHGRSPAGASPADHEWSALAGDLLAVADHEGLDGFAAGGASMGCATVLFAALREPERIQALVLAIPPTAWETRAAQAETYLAGVSFLEAKGLAAYVEATRKLPPQPPWTAPTREARLDLLAAADPAALALALRGAAASNLPDREELRSITVPALILAWDGDPGHPLSTASALHELLPSSELVVAASLEDVRAWPDRVRSFLA
jgi:3-oxoadipate enol-lactonase